jgi:hypothetical protein
MLSDEGQAALLALLHLSPKERAEVSVEVQQYARSPLSEQKRVREMIEKRLSGPNAQANVCPTCLRAWS